MDNITMTIDATQMSRVRSVCPQVGRVLLAADRGPVQGIAVPASRIADAPTFVGGFGATSDLEFRPFGEPPV